MRDSFSRANGVTASNHCSSLHTHLCNHCEQMGQVTPADQVDHIQVPNGDRVLQRDSENLMSLCALPAIAVRPELKAVRRDAGSIPH